MQKEIRTWDQALGCPETDNATHLIQCLLFFNNMPFILLGSRACNNIYVVKSSASLAEKKILKKGPLNRSSTAF